MGLRSVSFGFSLKSRIILILNSFLGALIIFIFVKTLFMRIFSAFLFFFFSYFLQQIIINCNQIDLGKRGHKQKRNVRLARKTLTSYYLWGVIFTIILLLVPDAPIRVYSGGIYLSLSSLSFLHLAKILSGLFLLTLFPGKIILDKLLRHLFKLDTFETLGLTVLFSYIINSLTGLILLKVTKNISALTFVTLTWIIVLLINLGQYLLNKGMRVVYGEEAVKNESTAKIFSSQNLLLVCVVIIFLFNSYVCVLSASPGGATLIGDAIYHFKNANEFVNFGSTFSPYIGFSVYLGIATKVTGLPIGYSYALLRVLFILVPTSIYMLTKTLFPKRKKACFISTALITFLGLTALPHLLAMIQEQDKFFDYLHGDMGGFVRTFECVRGVWGYILLYPGMLDKVIGLFCLSFTYRYLSYNGKNKRIELVYLFLCSLLATLTFYVHNVFFITLFICTITLFILFDRYNAGSKKLLMIITTMVLCYLPFGYLSGWHYLTRSEASFFYITRIIPFLVAASFGSLLIKERFLSKWSCQFKINSDLKQLRARTLLMTSAILLFVVSVYMSVLDDNLINLLPPFFVLPWHITILRCGLPFFITICTLHRLIHIDEKKPLKFLLSLLLSLCLIGLSAPLFTAITGIKNTVFRRYLELIPFPLAILSAISLDSMDVLEVKQEVIENKLKSYKGYMHKLFLLILVLLTTFASLSIIYECEFFLWFGHHVYPFGNPYAFPFATADAFTWINSELSPNEVIVAAGLNSYNMLCGYANVKSLPPKTLIPLCDFISYRARATKDKCGELYPKEDIIAYLNNQGINYIYLEKGDIVADLSPLKLILPLFPVVYENSVAKIYRVPTLGS